jgi:hypothetical protein
MNICLQCNKEYDKTAGAIGKFCSLSCSSTFNGIISKQKTIEKYILNPSHCAECKEILPIKKKQNKFCSRSCAGTYNNARKDYSKITSGPAKGFVPTNYAPYTKISQCVICNKYHPGQGKSCSSKCFSKVVSMAVRGKTGGNRDVNLPGVDSNGNKFYFDSNWEITLANSLTDNGIFWTRPKRFILSNGRSYTPDFYLKDYNVYIDPKAKRPGYYRKSVLKIEMFEKEYNTKCLIITSPKLLSWSHIQTMLLVSNTRS